MGGQSGCFRLFSHIHFPFGLRSSLICEHSVHFIACSLFRSKPAVIWNVIDTIDFIQDLEYNYVNIVDIVGDPVADGICQKRVRQLLQPSLNVRLRTEDRGVSLVTGLHDFQ